MGQDDRCGGATYILTVRSQRTRSRFGIKRIKSGEQDNPAACRFARRCPFATELCRTEAPAWEEITPADTCVVTMPASSPSPQGE